MHGQLEEIPTTGMKPRGSIQRDSSMVQLTIKGLTSSLFHLVLEGGYVLACRMVWLLSSFPLQNYYPILIGNSPTE
ncbi:hypothetical protein ERO13_D01G075116v2 [Gossypium hirsutum]|uniref:Uncharacterized protein n=2 Tax=Gossypium TaxID=3633 RepID=A0A5J5SLP5_GOSBA|nr:hypothetical protein ES319_D01G091800v1 [Gossypium barbadense]KAG4161742.1 hypothetical protein ERO13_D01G075116v2 [Gossypium hirsutum]TYI96779.1 hypothetical protein E1A91_D01G097300v1 [Gossypium mustelinum]